MKIRRPLKLRPQCVYYYSALSVRSLNVVFRPKLVSVKKKLDRREAVREREALSALHIEKSIEKELLERLCPKLIAVLHSQVILDHEKKA